MSSVKGTARWSASDGSKSETRCAMGGRSDNRETRSFDFPGASGHWAVVETTLGSPAC